MDTPTLGSYEHVKHFRVGPLSPRPAELDILHDAYQQRAPVPATSTLFGKEYDFQAYVTRYDSARDTEGYDVYAIGLRIDMSSFSEADAAVLERQLAFALALCGRLDEGQFPHA